MMKPRILWYCAIFVALKAGSHSIVACIDEKSSRNSLISNQSSGSSDVSRKLRTHTSSKKVLKRQSSNGLDVGVRFNDSLAMR